MKLFGFGTKSIIVVHFIQTFLAISNGVLIYLILKSLSRSIFYSGLAVLFWVLILITPIGNWGIKLEYESAFALEAESICIFLSLLAIYLLLQNFFNNAFKSKLCCSFAGLLSALAIMFKVTGGILFLSVLCWFIYFLLFDRQQIRHLRFSIIYFLVGFVLTFVVFNMVIYFIQGDLFSFWTYSFAVGSYSQEFLFSPKNFLLMIYKFMMRGLPLEIWSVSNFILFLFLFICLLWGVLRGFFIKEEENLILKLFIPLLAIWGIGNICAVIAPGEYGSYYYILVWPSVAIFLVIGLRDLFLYVNLFKTKATLVIVVLFISIFFVHRILVLSDRYLELARDNIRLNILLQPESFQDPVKLTSLGNLNPYRPPFLQTADFVNLLLPDKEDTFYIFNFTMGHQDFSPTFYIYAKRLPPTSIVSDILHYKNFLDLKIDVLSNDLVKNPPKVIILPEVLAMKEWQNEKLAPFFKWFKSYSKKKYHYRGSFPYQYPNAKKEIYHIIERN